MGVEAANPSEAFSSQPVVGEIRNNNFPFISDNNFINLTAPVDQKTDLASNIPTEFRKKTP
jgi:hypothetical protein